MNWVAPTAVFVVLVGILGITSKYALRALSWQEVVVWSAAAYVIAAVVLVASGTPVRVYGGLNGWMAVLTAIIAPSSLALLLIALRGGEASRIIPVTSVYPLVTVLLAFIILHEEVSAIRVLGSLLVVLGVVLLTL